MTGGDLAAFAAFHEPALSLDEARHSIMLGHLARARGEASSPLKWWTLGAPGRCAVMRSPHSIVLGDLDRAQCRKFAELAATVDYPGVMGSDETADWFAERATELGIAFAEPERQGLYGLSAAPNYPGASGFARPLAGGDWPVFSEWVAAFHREAVPNDPLPSTEEIRNMARGSNFLLWIDGNCPVSIAGIRRRLKSTAAISNVYTPPERRGRGYAGSVTAALVERIFAEGYKSACLYADQRNPASNRCYRKIGFELMCRSAHFRRILAQV
jgi:hypothetical protein